MATRWERGSQGVVALSGEPGAERNPGNYPEGLLGIPQNFRQLQYERLKPDWKVTSRQSGLYEDVAAGSPGNQAAQISGPPPGSPGVAS